MQQEEKLLFSFSKKNFNYYLEHRRHRHINRKGLRENEQPNHQFNSIADHKLLNR